MCIHKNNNIMYYVIRNVLSTSQDEEAIAIEGDCQIQIFFMRPSTLFNTLQWLSTDCPDCEGSS